MIAGSVSAAGQASTCIVAGRRILRSSAPRLMLKCSWVGVKCIRGNRSPTESPTLHDRHVSEERTV
eukprot:824261-Pyramimonas_sp.AAC.1